MGSPNRNIKLIAIDLDGTLLNEAHQISVENQAAIKEAEKQGVHVVISTGRSKITSQDLVDSLSLHTYVINVNGSEIWDEDGTLMERQLLDTIHIEQMWKLKEKYQTTCWATTVCNVWKEPFPKDFASYEWLKFGFDIKDNALRELILSELAKNDALEITNSSLTNIEINAKGVNKARAIEKVCQRIGITMENVLAIGDSVNDLAMIQQAGIGVAMGNAQQIVKDAADWVTTTNVENGVAKAIRTWAIL